LIWISQCHICVVSA